ncbi:DUF1963 domain-containing protein [Cystobacter fuscus]|uniref:DUF1963 domain-containing protein n=1 Tax=Cystobacter fuscus TaxID=43 RepID=UPI002B2D62AA|nr:DUF1963 domain-containing protein [Cystobacter fuscus]
MTAPPQLSPQLREALSRLSPRVAAGMVQTLQENLRPCLLVESERVSQAPLHRGALGRMLGLRTDTPRLALLDSKLGGTPYTTGPMPGGRWFLGQLNFAQLPPSVPGLPRQGLLAVDGVRVRSAFGLSFTSRWYPRPSEEEAVAAQRVARFGRFEAVLRFRESWSLPCWEELAALLPEDAWWLSDDVDEWQRESGMCDERCHRLGGHRSFGQDSLNVFEPPTGLSKDFREYEQLFRLNFDNAADFSWGSNQVYLLVHREDLAAQRFDRLAFAVANG